MTEITPESTATFPIHFGLLSEYTGVENLIINTIIEQGQRRTVVAPRGGGNFYCFLHLVKDRTALWNRGWCDSSLLHSIKSVH